MHICHHPCLMKYGTIKNLSMPCGRKISTMNFGKIFQLNITVVTIWYAMSTCKTRSTAYKSCVGYEELSCWNMPFRDLIVRIGCKSIIITKYYEHIFSGYSQTFSDIHPCAFKSSSADINKWRGNLIKTKRDCKLKLSDVKELLGNSFLMGLPPD